jgi:hypothetical protein
VGFSNCQTNFFVSRAVLPGCSFSRAPKNARLAQKLRRVRRHMFFCALPDGFWVRTFLKSTLAFLCLPISHAAVWPRNPDLKLTRSAAARLVSNNTLTHTQTHFPSVFVWCESVFDSVRKGACVYMCTQNPSISVECVSLSLGLSLALLSLRNQNYPWIVSE